MTTPTPEELVELAEPSEEAVERVALPQWRPIETAPKDGSYVIAGRFGPNWDLKWVMHSRWITQEECADYHGGVPEEYEAGWTRGENEDDAAFPTHWLPLPAPPAMKGDSDG